MSDMNRDYITLKHRVDLVEVKLKLRAYRNAGVKPEEKEKEKDTYRSMLLPD